MSSTLARQPGRTFADSLGGKRIAKAQPLKWFDQSRDDIQTDNYFGEYIYAPTPNQWCNSWTIGSRLNIRVFGEGRDPTADQRATMQFILASIDHLEARGLESIPEPPAIKRKQSSFDRSAVSLAEIWLAAEPHQFTLAFNSPTGDDIDTWPIVEFQSNNVTDAWWAP